MYMMNTQMNSSDENQNSGEISNGVNPGEFKQPLLASYLILCFNFVLPSEEQRESKWAGNAHKQFANRRNRGKSINDRYDQAN